MNTQPSVLQASGTDNPAGTGCLIAIINLIMDTVTSVTTGAAGVIIAVMTFHR